MYDSHIIACLPHSTNMDFYQIIFRNIVQNNIGLIHCSLINRKQQNMRKKVREKNTWFIHAESRMSERDIHELMYKVTVKFNM